ncbi:CesT family type III secretion system chaperone, partial [Erwinia oleae]|uniref:CesT family type III secretion system chaperone n=1 Tax=Erwinia oleae TaxID=796334 RepID=UPI000557070E
MSASLFHRTVEPLLRHLKVDPTALAGGNSYHIEFPHYSVQLLNIHQVSLLMLLSPGRIAEESDPSLPWTLLQLNMFDGERPAIHISALAEQKSLVLWTQERLTQIDAAGVIAQFDRLVARGEEVAQLCA